MIRGLSRHRLPVVDGFWRSPFIYIRCGVNHKNSVNVFATYVSPHLGNRFARRDKQTRLLSALRPVFQTVSPIGCRGRLPQHPPRFLCFQSRSLGRLIAVFLSTYRCPGRLFVYPFFLTMDLWGRFVADIYGRPSDDSRNEYIWIAVAVG